MTTAVIKLTSEDESPSHALHFGTHAVPLKRGQCVLFNGNVDHHVPKVMRDYDRITVVMTWWQYR
jgi:predicted 2-oxoglutarate/Fe(II)-dependent dioxygenase YbiX